MEAISNYTQIDDIVNSIIEQIHDAESNLEISVEAKKKRCDSNFEITHRDTLALAILVGDSPVNIAEAYIIKNVRSDCGMFIGSIDDISKGANVSRSTVKRTIADMQKKDLIRYYADKVWAINPRLLRKGSDGKFAALSRMYYSLEKRV